MKEIVGGAVLLKDDNNVLNLLCCRTGRCLTGGCLTSSTSAPTTASAAIKVKQETGRAEEHAPEQYASANRSSVKGVHATSLRATLMRLLRSLDDENELNVISLVVETAIGAGRGS
jgi:hypothetical protein